MDYRILTLRSEERGAALPAVEMEGELWFSGKGACGALGIGNPSRALSEHVGEGHKRYEKMKFLGKRGGWLVDGEGLASLADASPSQDAHGLIEGLTGEEAVKAALEEPEAVVPEIEEATQKASPARRTVEDIKDVDYFTDGDGTAWFRLSDVGMALGLDGSSVRKMRQNGWFDPFEIKDNVSRIVEESCVAHPVKIFPSPSVTEYGTTYISESALYRILNRSNSPKAEPFRQWVTQEVIPRIRKTGTYSMNEGPEEESGFSAIPREPASPGHGDIPKANPAKRVVNDISEVDYFTDGDGTAWFRLSDVGRALGLSDSSVRKMHQNEWFDPFEIRSNVVRKATASCIENSVKIFHGNSDLSNTGYRYTYISESALYRVLNRSNSPKARPFERWVTQEVLPTIRRKGVYATDEFLEKTLLTPEWGIKILESLRDARKQRDEAVRTKALIGSRREATAMAAASAQKRRAEALQLANGKLQIANGSLQEENGKLQEDNARLQTENGDLRDRIGDSERFKAVRAIPWTKDMFDMKTRDIWESALGGRLTKMCRAAGREFRKVPDSKFGTVNAYPVDMIEIIHVQLLENPKILEKYRLKIS